MATQQAILRPLSAASLIGVLLSGGCTKSEESKKTEHNKTEQKVAGAASGAASAKVDAKKPAEAAASAAKKLTMPQIRQATLSATPAKCPAGRFYADVAGLVKFGFDMASMERLEEAAQQAEAKEKEKGDEKKSSLPSKLKAGGLDPAKDIKAIAVCRLKEDAPVIALGVDLSGMKGDPLGLLEAGFRASELSPKKAKIDGLPVLKADGQYIGFARDSVLVVANDEEGFEAAKKGGGEASFKDALGSLAYFNGTTEGKSVKFTLTDADDKLQLELLTSLADPFGKQLKEAPESVLKNIRALMDTTAKQVDKTDLKPLATVLKQLKVAEKEGLLRIHGTLDKQTVQQLGKAASSTTRAQIAKLMD